MKSRISSLKSIYKHYGFQKNILICLTFIFCIIPQILFCQSQNSISIIKLTKSFLRSISYSCDTLKGIISNFDLLITSRFHSLVSALSTQTYSIAIGWSHKYREIMAPFEQEEYAFLWNKVEIGDLKEAVGKILKQVNTKPIQISKMEKSLNSMFKVLQNYISES